MEEFSVGDLQLATEWALTEGASIFQTKAQWEHFVRKHGDELVQVGALIRQRGRAGNLVTPKIGKEVVRLLHETSMAELRMRGVA